MADLLTLSSRIVDSGVAEDPHNRITQELSEVAADIAVVESFSHSIVVRTDGRAGRLRRQRRGHRRRRRRGDPGLVDRSVQPRHLHPRPRRPRRGQRGVRRRRRGPRRRAADLPRPRERARAAGPLRAHQRLEPADQPPAVRVAARRPRHGHRRRERSLPARRRRRPRRHLPRRAHRRRRPARRSASSTPAARPTTTRGRGCPSSGWRASATCSSGTSRTPATRRRCSATRRTGRPRCASIIATTGAAAAGPRPADRRTPAHRPRPRRRRHRAGVARPRRAGDDERWLVARRDHPHRARRRRRARSCPYMRPLYDEPEFVIRNVWRRYGGWWDADPANLKPAPRPPWPPSWRRWPVGADRLATRAVELADAGDLRLACHLVELAAAAAPDDPAVHAARAAIYERRRQTETSLMTKGIYAAAVRESRAERLGPTECRSAHPSRFRAELRRARCRRSGPSVGASPDRAPRGPRRCAGRARGPCRGVTTGCRGSRPGWRSSASSPSRRGRRRCRRRRAAPGR